MSTAETTNKPDPTKGTYWGGPILSYNTYWWLAVLPTGFFGIDHLALRSPSTAWKKFLTNIFFLGFWYFYDFVQALKDKDNIARFGLSSPFGPLGIGYNLFTDMDPKNIIPPSENVAYGNTLFYILYIIGLILPFGLSNMAAGDFYGGLLRLFSCMLVWTIPLYVIYGVMEAWNASDSPADIFEKGITRVVPLDWILGTDFYPPTKLVSPTKAKPLQDKYDKIMKDQTLVGRITGLASTLGMKVLEWVGGPVLGTVKTTAKAACAATDTAIEAGEAATQIVEAGNGLKDAVSQASPSAPGVEPIIMKGGAMELPSLGDGMLLSGVLFLILGGLGITLLRKMMNSKKRDGKDTLDDTPPEARSV